MKNLHALICKLRHLRAILSSRRINIPKHIQKHSDVTHELLRAFYTYFDISDSQNACKCTIVAFQSVDVDFVIYEHSQHPHSKTFVNYWFYHFRSIRCAELFSSAQVLHRFCTGRWHQTIVDIKLFLRPQKLKCADVQNFTPKVFFY